MPIRDYDYLLPDVILRQREVPVYKERQVPGVTLRPDARTVTLSQYDRDTKNYITAHDIKDYRISSFRLSNLPYVTTLFDKLLALDPYFSKALAEERVH